MADIGASNWSETDASNTTAAPDGAPEGMAPSGVNDVLRAHQGATKRFWNHINAVKTTGGTTSAYTLTYDVAPAAYYDGEIFSFVVNAANAASATLNVNALGAKTLRLFGGALLAGALQANQIVMARYNSGAGAFDIITNPGWTPLSKVSASAAATVDFASIPSGVNHLMLLFEVRPSVDGAAISLRTYGADGLLDTGSTDYWYIDDSSNTGSSSSTVAYAGTASFILLADSVDNANAGCLVRAEALNIQAATHTKFTYQSGYLNSAGSLFVSVAGFGGRLEADRITGLRVQTSSGTITGEFTLLASL